MHADTDIQFDSGKPQYWHVSLSLEYADKYKEAIMNEKLQNILWDNIFYCTHYRRNGKGCNPNKSCAGGRNITILGKEIKGICWSRTHAVITNPDETTLNGIKKLL